VALIQGDIRNVAAAEVARHLQAGEAVVVTAGMPCQTYSTAGTRSRTSYDHRQVLFREAIRIAAAVRADLLLLENVPAIRSKPLGPGDQRLVIDLLRSDLDAAGYATRVEAVLDASQYGVPQARRRWFLLAARDHALTPKLPEPTTAGRPVRVREAFAGLPHDLEMQEYTGASSDYADLLRDDTFWRLGRPADRLTWHVAPGHRGRTVARYSLLRWGRRVDGLFRKFDSATVASLQGRGVLPGTPFLQRGRRLHPDRPSPTLTCHCGEELVHPWANRVLSVRECARLMSFPDGYQFCGPLTAANDSEGLSVYRQTGNAVPPLLAYRLGLAILEVLR
jgi:DNA (cytosine-5)-methyltransferase 1